MMAASCIRAEQSFPAARGLFNSFELCFVQASVKHPKIVLSACSGLVAFRIGITQLEIKLENFAPNGL